MVSVVAAVERDVKAFAELLPGIDESAEAATALALAAELDDRNSATSKSMCARALAELMLQMRSRLPEERVGDSLDDLAARRAARLAGKSAAEPAVGS